MKITRYRVWNLSSKEKSSLYAVKKTVEKKVNIEPAQIYIEWKKYLERLLLESGLQPYTQHNEQKSCNSSLTSFLRVQFLRLTLTRPKDT